MRQNKEGQIMSSCKYLRAVRDGRADGMMPIAARAFRSLLVFSGLVGCSCEVGLAGPSPAPSTARSVLVFIDESASIDAVAYRHWNQLAAANLCRANTRVTVYAIDDVTSQGAPLADERLPLPDRRSGWAGMKAAQADLAAGQGRLRAALAEAMTPRRGARWSDILSTIDRAASRRPDATTTIVLFTDAVHSMAELDFERTSTPRVVDPIVEARGWNRHTLNGARVHIVMAAARSGAPRPPVDKATLARFWTAIVKAAGGELASFDTELELPEEA
jgi:hypothetical protein